MIGSFSTVLNITVSNTTVYFVGRSDNLNVAITGINTTRTRIA